MNKIKFLKPALYATFLTLTVAMATINPISESHAIDRAEDLDPATLDGPPRKGTWETPPPVVVCKDALVTKKEVQKAMDFWTERGYEFGEILFHKNPENACTDDTPFGYIVIRKVTREVIEEMEGSTLAETHFYVNPRGNKIEFAIIYLVYKPVERVLEHEFGHTLTFYHYNIRGHLMHVRNSYGGWDDYGLHITHNSNAKKSFSTRR